MRTMTLKVSLTLTALLALASTASATPPQEIVPVIFDAYADAMDGTGDLTIHGANFGTEPGTVVIGDQLATVSDWTDTSIEAVLPSETPPGTYLLFISSGKGLYHEASSFVTVETASELRSLALAGSTLEVVDEAGTTHAVDLSSLVDDADADPTNELQSLALAGTTLSLTEGGAVDLGAFLDNTDDQLLVLTGDTLALEDGGSVDLSPYLDNTDDQQLVLTGETLALEDGGSVDLSPYLDNTDAQTLAFAAGVLSISNGNAVDLSTWVASVVAAAVADEASLRAAGDAALTACLADEASLRAAGDAALSASLSDEATTRAAGDTALAASLAEEVSLRTAGDAALSASLSDEATARAAGDTTLAASLSDEASLRAAGDATLAAGLSDEATTRAAFDAGAITGVSVATGLTGGGTDGDVSVGWDASAIQARVSGSCAAGTAIRQVDATGAVTCEPMTENTDSQTLSLSGLDLSISGGNTVSLPVTTPGLADVLDAGQDGGGADAVHLGGVVGAADATATAEQDGSSDRADKVYLPYAGTGIWQSFTAEATGLLTQVDLHHYTGVLTDATLSIYAGEGASGTPILSDHIGAREGGGWQSYVLSTPVPVIRGLQYTIRMVDTGGQWQWEFYSGAAGDTYLGGRASTKPIEDMRFKTFVIPAPGVDFAAGDVAVLGSALRPAVDAATDLGTADHRWRTVYASDGVIQTSDARLKCNIHDSPYGLREVMALRPVAYHWKSGQGAQMLGFLAQEVEPIVPEAVVGGPAEGRAYGMSYTELLPVVTKAVQEQQAQLEEQRRLIATQRQLIDLQSDKLSRLEAELERLREATGR